MKNVQNLIISANTHITKKLSQNKNEHFLGIN